MRLILMRYIGKSCSWYPMFVLKELGTDHLILGDGLEPKLFNSAHEAVGYVSREYPEASIEWEGTTF